MTNKRTQAFNGLLPEYPFCVQSTKELYPDHMRETDEELDVDKAMTVLGAAEDQIRSFVTAYPFDPEEIGFRRTAYGMYELDKKSETKLIYSPTPEDDSNYKVCFKDEDGNIIVLNASLRNHTTAQVVLRALKVIPEVEEKAGIETVEFEELPKE